MVYIDIICLIIEPCFGRRTQRKFSLFLEFLPEHFAQTVIRSIVDGVQFVLLMFL